MADSSTASSRGHALARTPASLIVLAWTLYGLVLIAQSALWWFAVGRRPTVWFAPLIYSFVIVWTWAAMTPAVMWLARRFSLMQPHTLSSAPVHAAAALCVTLITALVEVGINNALPGGGTNRFILTYVDRFDVSFFFYVGAVAFTHALDHAGLARERQLRTARLEAELNSAQLRTLRMQIQPHFLFNTLNTISSLVHRDRDAADATISRLGELLRLTLEERNSPEWTLRQELELVRRYAEIEQIRFDDWLTVEFLVEPEVLDARVPGMLLQPILENAIRHGIAPLGRPGRVRVRAARVTDELVLIVQDDGVGLPEDGELKCGIGLTATADRLEHLYGSAHELTISSASPTGTTVQLRIPFVVAPRDEPSLASLAAPAVPTPG